MTYISGSNGHGGRNRFRTAGMHFAALEKPESIIDDVRCFYRDKR
jgi:hypothetical protein